MIPLFLENFGHPQGLLEGLPILGAISPVPAYAFGHLPVERLGRGQVGFWAGKFPCQLQSKMALPAPRAAGDEDDFFIIHIFFATEITENTENFKNKTPKLHAKSKFNILYLIFWILILLCVLCTTNVQTLKFLLRTKNESHRDRGERRERI